MTGHLAWGITFAVFCVIGGMLIAGPIGYAHGRKRAAEDAEDALTAAIVDEWKGLPDEDAGAEDALTAAIVDEWKGLPDEDAGPEPPWPPAPPQAPRPGPGKHRHPSGPPRHAERPAGPPRRAALPASGYLPAEPGPWNQTLTLPAPVQTPPWEQPEPPTQVLEPTAVLPPDPGTDTAWDLVIAAQAADMDRWLAENISATDSTLKAITR